MSEKKMNWGSLILGILFVIAALVAFRNPLSDLYAITVVFGIAGIANGIWLIVYRFGLPWRVLLGVVDILLGILILLNPVWGAIALPFVFAIWFIINSLWNLFNLKAAKLMGKGYFWLSLILNVLCLIVGILLFFDPVSSALTLTFLIGFYFMLAGFELIFFAFADRT